jgi:hypothetical protein
VLTSEITRVVVLYKSSLSGHRVGEKTGQTASLKAQVKTTRSVIASKICRVVALSFNRAGMGCTAAARPHVIVAKPRYRDKRADDDSKRTERAFEAE